MTKKVINGPRPSSLMINKDSHLIRKPSVSETMILHKKQRNDPIIIYTESPKVIHTKAQDFMALVQRLTGMSISNEASENFGSSLSDGSKSKKQGSSDHGDETSSAVRRDDDETYVENSPYNYLGFADIPLFSTPNSSHLFCSYRSVVYKYSDSPYGILGSLISPSCLEFLKQLPEF